MPKPKMHHAASIKQAATHNGHGLHVAFTVCLCGYMCDNLRQTWIDLLIDFKSGHPVLIRRKDFSDWPGPRKQSHFIKSIKFSPLKTILDLSCAAFPPLGGSFNGPVGSFVVLCVSVIGLPVCVSL